MPELHRRNLAECSTSGTPLIYAMWFFMIACYALTGISYLLLVATALQGVLKARWDIPLWDSHLNLGLITIILYLFTEVLVMFFFIGTGSSVKDYVKQHGLDAAIYDRVKKLKHLLFPGTTMSIILVSLAFILGGAADKSGLPPIVHGLFSLIALIHFTRVIAVQNRCFRENTEIIRDMVSAMPANGQG